MSPHPQQRMSATIVVATSAFDEDLTALTEQHGFRINSIFPADAPHTAIVSAAGLRLRLESADHGAPAAIYVDTHADSHADSHVDTGAADNPRQSTGRSFAPILLPGGTRIEPTPDLSALNAAALSTITSPGSVVITRQDGSSGVGRAGMRYRDLLPDRWDGRYIVSHITIPAGGPVPDYVHYHRIDFQMIFVKEGWVKVVYEDQGEPFVMHRGDCVLQPPQIRHRVLEASPGLEVIEIGTPALHETIADWSMELPNGSGDPMREWSGQRFVRHVAEGATYGPWINPKWVCRDTGIGAVTKGLAAAIVARPGETDAPPGPPTFVADAEFASISVLQGEVTINSDGDADTPAIEPERLVTGANIVVPSGYPINLRSPTPDCELLVVTINRPG